MDTSGSLVVGLSAGALYAVFGVLLTLMATLTRVVNFSQVAVGVFGAYLSLRFVPLEVPDWAIIVIAMIASAAISCGLGWIISTWLGESSTTARSAVTVATLLGLMSLSFIVFGTRPQANPPLLIGPLFSIGTIAVTKVGVLMLRNRDRRRGRREAGAVLEHRSVCGCGPSRIASRRLSSWAST